MEDWAPLQYFLTSQAPCLQHYCSSKENDLTASGAILAKGIPGWAQCSVSSSCSASVPQSSALCWGGCIGKRFWHHSRCETTGPPPKRFRSRPSAQVFPSLRRCLFGYYYCLFLQLDPQQVQATSLRSNNSLLMRISGRRDRFFVPSLLKSHEILMGIYSSFPLQRFQLWIPLIWRVALFSFF